MIKTSRTSRMEESVLLLDKSYDKVMVRADHQTEMPIRLRVKMLEAIDPHYLRSNEAFDSQIPVWNEEGGTLINYRRYQKMEKAMPHEALLICEAPLSLDILDDLTRDTKQECVIYRPPTWRQHEELVFAKHPPGTQCKQFVQAVTRAKPIKEYALIAQKLNIPTAGTHAINDDELRELLGKNRRDMEIMRKRALSGLGSRRYSLVHPLIPRIEPEDHTLMEIYKAITELPAFGKVNLARDNVLSKAARFWKTALRALVRSGSVERRPTIGFYFTGGIMPNYDNLQAQHLAAQAKLKRLIATVDSLPDHLPRPSPQKSSAPASP